MASRMRETLLKEAEALVRTRGFAAFSYADLSEKVGIRKASIHHYFPSKEELGVALIDGYLVPFEAALEDILVAEPGARARLERYAAFFVQSMSAGMLPLCGALSAELAALPASMQTRVQRFFAIHIHWLENVIGDGVARRELRDDINVKAAALLVLSALEGASFVAWATKDPSVIPLTIAQVVASLQLR